MSTGYWRRSAVSIMIVALVSLLLTPFSEAQAPASWGGRVFNGDRVTPRQGVVISLLDSDGDQSTRSLPTRNDGAFVIDAPAGTYTLAVETADGVFLSADPLQLQSGRNQPMALSLQAASSPFHADGEQGLGGEGSTSNMTKYIIAGAVSLFGLFVLYELFNDDSNEVPATYTVVP